MIRRPYEPVSSSTWSIVWHTAVPGRHTVTLTNGALNWPPAPAGPLSTTIGIEFAGAATVTATLLLAWPHVIV